MDVHQFDENGKRISYSLRSSEDDEKFIRRILNEMLSGKEYQNKDQVEKQIKTSFAVRGFSESEEKNRDSNGNIRLFMKVVAIVGTIIIGLVVRNIWEIEVNQAAAQRQIEKVQNESK